MMSQTGGGGVMGLFLTAKITMYAFYISIILEGYISLFRHLNQQQKFRSAFKFLRRWLSISFACIFLVIDMQGHLELGQGCN